MHRYTHRYTHRSIFTRAAAVLLTGLCLVGGPALAQTKHVRGEITAISGDVATVATASGDVEVTMAPDLGVLLYRKIAIEDLKPDDYLSIPSTTAADGQKQALAINVFPAALKGVGEGESPWDMGPDSKMTNAAFATMEAQGADHSIVVSYNGEQETILVPEGTPITSFGPDPDRKLAVGDKTVFFTKDADGKLTSARAGVTEDGSLPPI